MHWHGVAGRSIKRNQGNWRLFSGIINCHLVCSKVTFVFVKFVAYLYLSVYPTLFSQDVKGILWLRLETATLCNLSRFNTFWEVKVFEFSWSKSWLLASLKIIYHLWNCFIIFGWLTVSVVSHWHHWSPSCSGLWHSPAPTGQARGNTGCSL